MSRFSVCFVCLGNICRSPLAEAVLRQKAEARGLTDRLHIESRGVGDWHLGEPADPRMQATASRHGVEMSGRAELFSPDDFAAFDLVLAMDVERYEELLARMPEGLCERVALFRDFDPEGDGDVPDPYYGGPEGFEEVFRIVDRTCDAILNSLFEGEGGSEAP